MDGGVKAVACDENIVVCDHFIDLFVRHANGALRLNGRSNLWIARVNLIAALLEGGYEVLSFDVDSVPISSIASLWPRDLSPDILAQQDYSIPVDVARRAGFVICCGLLWCLPTMPAKSLISQLCRQTEFYLDDQIAINKIMFDGSPKIETLRNGRLIAAHGVRMFLPDVASVSRQLYGGSVVRHIVIDDYGYQTVVNYFRSLVGPAIDGS
jgi:hypothetical protein